jgi:hypothetical protein
MRNKWFSAACPECRVPAWKLAKYSATEFRRHSGSALGSSSE